MIKRTSVTSESSQFSLTQCLCVALSALAALTGCPPDPDPDPIDGSTEDASTSNDAARDGGSAPRCQRDADCAAPATEPVGCAEAVCDSNTGKCLVRSRDADGDTFRAANCRATSGEPVSTGSDCDDTKAAVHPGAKETCNKVDDDCNGQVDDGVVPAAPGTCSAGVGECSRSGVLLCTAGEWKCSAVAAATTRTTDKPECDGKDYDCNGMHDNGCSCTKGQTRLCPGECNPVTISCTNGAWPGCPAPQSRQVRCADNDRDGYPDSGRCSASCDPLPGDGSFIAPRGDGKWDCRDSDIAVNPGASEVCDDKDNDCNGATPEPRQTCSGGGCGARQVSCGQLASCGSLCPPPLEMKDGVCQAQVTYGYFSFGQDDHGDVYLGTVPVSPGAEGATVTVETDISIPTQCNAGSCCSGDDTIVANIHCGNGHSQNIAAKQFNVGSTTISLDGCSQGAAVYLNRLNNAWTACASFTCCGKGCARRFTETRIKLIANACKP